MPQNNDPTAKDMATQTDDFFYTGQNCSCGERLYLWAIPSSPKEQAVQLSGWIPIVPPSCYHHRIVTAHSLDDAKKALLGKAVKHDSYLRVGDAIVPRLAHGQPTGTVLIADFCSYGAFGEGLRDTVLSSIFSECRIGLSVINLREELWRLMPGDFFFGMLCELEPGGIFEENHAVRFIEQLEDEWLPKGAKAILETTTLRGRRIDETAELCLGRIILAHLPSPEQVRSLVAEMRSS